MGGRMWHICIINNTIQNKNINKYSIGLRCEIFIDT